MSEIIFSKQLKEELVTKLCVYFEKELNQELGQFDAEFLIDFISQEMGGAYYNQGLADAQSILNSKLDDISHALYEIEKPSII